MERGVVRRFSKGFQTKCEVEPIRHLFQRLVEQNQLLGAMEDVLTQGIPSCPIDNVLTAVDCRTRKNMPGAQTSLGSSTNALVCFEISPGQQRDSMD